jgi:hypothetical protein
MRRTQLPEKVMAAGVPRAFKADSGPGNLELMDARGLSGELDRLASTTLSSRVRSEAREGLSIFAPDGSSEDQLLARMTLETSSEDAFPAESPAALTEPQVRAVTLAWVRTVFGRRVQVQDIDASQDGPEVAREISVHTLTPQRFLTGLRDLVEAGLGFELKEVVFRKEQEVEVLLAFGTGIRGLDSLERFVENVRSLPQVEVTSDLSRRIPDGQSLYARFLVPNR